MGKNRSPAYFLNREKCDQANVIFLCQDMRTAIYLNRLIANNVYLEREGSKPIVTAHLGEDLSVLEWNLFYGADVYFIPAPSKRHMSLVKHYRDYLGDKGAGARHFSIYPGFLLHTLPKESPDAMLSDTERFLLEKAVYLPRVENISLLINNIHEDSLSCEGFVRWGEDVGIFKKSFQKQTVAKNEEAELPPLSSALKPVLASRLEDVTIYHIFRPGTNVLLLGAKGSGKTQTALSACRALLCPGDQWPFFPSGEETQEKIVYVDAETPFDEYEENLQQYGLTAFKEHRFWGVNMFDPKLPEQFASFRLDDPQFREALTRHALSNGCRYIFLDNLTALMGNRVELSVSMSDVMEWARRLQAKNMCVVFIHHKHDEERTGGRNGKPRGNLQSELLARTKISLISKNEILAAHSECSAYYQSAREDGLTVGICYQVCKAAPVLDNKTFWFHLPLKQRNWSFLAATGSDGSALAEFPASSVDRNISISSTEDILSPQEPEPYPQLTPDEITLITLLRKEKGVAPRRTLEDKGEFKKDNLLSILKNLTEKNLVKMEGQGKSSYYRLLDTSI